MCSTCHGPAAGGARLCRSCARLPGELDAVLPISLSPADSELAYHLRAYKDDPCATERDASRRVLSVILGVFLDFHMPCLEARAGAEDGFELVSTVPCRHAADGAGRLAQMVENLDKSTRRHYLRLLEHGRSYGVARCWSPERYHARVQLRGEAVLLVDDTWTSGASAQAAAYALRIRGAGPIALLVIGRHLQRCDSRVLATNASERFQWERCALSLACRAREDRQERARGLAPGGRT